jgi:rhamnose utilization protein RhaD (predicted bifunctional aldolase and dehydrogenase)
MAYLMLKMLGPHGVITISRNFRDAYECERQVVEEAERALILDEPRPEDGIKRKMRPGIS